jgi:prophage regulatory protein
MAICKNVTRSGSMTAEGTEFSERRQILAQPVDEKISRSGPIRMLRLAQVIAITGLGKTKIYELQSEGSFPMRVQITAHSVGWIEEEVQAWLARKIAASTSLPARAPHQGLRRPSP